MGLFNKIKNMFAKDKSDESNVVAVLDEGEEERFEEIVEETSKEIDPSLKKEYKKHKEKVKKDEEKELEEEKKLQEEVKVYEKGLTKSREGFVSKLANLTNKYHKITEEYFDELEEILIMADIGVDTVISFMDRLRKRVKHENIESTEYLKEIIVDELFIIYVNDSVIVNKINFSEKKPTVILFVGVNGVGKTTTIAKLANKMIDEGKKVKLVAGDTFRAGATRQLEEWLIELGHPSLEKKKELIHLVLFMTD